MFLNMNKIDIALISETRFTSKSFLSVKGYTTYNTNHPSGNAHGGTAVLIKCNIKHHSLEPFATDKIQATLIKVSGKSSDITIAAVYCPPKHQILREDYRHFFSQLGHRYIIGDDWNAKHLFWGSRLITTRGRQLYQAVKELNLECLSTGEPTYWPTDPRKTPDLLDFFITKNIIINNTSVESDLDLTSDHSTVILNVNDKIISNEAPPRLYNKKTNWEEYRDIITEETQLTVSLKTVQEVEQAIEDLNKLIHSAAHAPRMREHLTEIIPSHQFGFREGHGTIEQVHRLVDVWVPQGSILGPVLYLIYATDLPAYASTTTATYADDTAILSTHENQDSASDSLQQHLNLIEKWLRQWQIKANTDKSVQVTFTLRKKTCPPVKLCNVEIPQTDDGKYLGMHLDRRLTWRKHIWTKRKQLDCKLRGMYWLIGRKSQLSDAIFLAEGWGRRKKPLWAVHAPGHTGVSDSQTKTSETTYCSGESLKLESYKAMTPTSVRGHFGMEMPSARDCLWVSLLDTSA
ncbi:RNA-directed DNA polymerase from mobile element jockey [Eumeta japonica]|uniref:RNA-directed DNA polymerase from mobile element jockey n=1 Tax=Eumeta variegata TaxID=151549 RepID=A0A4C1WTI9_EUMVA|nr:RNA-directed DNA polymerase from mobile element jockey [Eumeta japonica]